MTIVEEVNQIKQEIHTDSYPMSIGEVISVYQEGDLEIHPEFQRFYRWTDEQKSKLIESILLGIPLPSFFVAQRDDGVWDVVDGLQRLSTILSFVGVYKKEDGEVAEPLVLKATDYLPSLSGMKWSNEEDPDHEIPKEIQRAFKREKIDIKIIKKESGTDTKYELFQRLNTGGSSLSPQEVRNCLLLMIDKTVYQWLKGLSDNEDFLSCLPLSKKQMDECYHMEVALRYFVYKHSTEESRKGEPDIGEYLTKSMTNILVSEAFNYEIEKQEFELVFQLLNEFLSDNSFKRFDQEKGRYSGAFSIIVFETIVSGVISLINNSDTDNHSEYADLICSKSQSLVEQEEFISASSKGVRGMERFPKLWKFGSQYIQQ